MENPHVERIEVKGGSIHLSTNDIYLQHKGQTYFLGRYLIEIPLEGGLPKMINENPKRDVKGNVFHHPHVYGVAGNSFCLGNIAAGVNKLIAEKEYAFAATMLIEYLHSCNDSPTYANILKAYFKPLEKPRQCTCVKKKRKEAANENE